MNFSKGQPAMVAGNPGARNRDTSGPHQSNGAQLRVQYNNLVQSKATNGGSAEMRSASSDQAYQLSNLITQVPQGSNMPIVPAAGVVRPPSPQQSPNQQPYLNLSNAQHKWFLGPQSERSRGKKTLVLDLDETLVHSSFRPPNSNEVIELPVEIDNKKFRVYVLVRPNAVQFLKDLEPYYELIIFTASLAKYANPLMDILDEDRCCSARLSRDHCTFYQGMYVKDLAELGRDLRDVLIIDNSQTAYLFQPDNALPIISWYDDVDDRCLYDYIPFLKALSKVDDVRPILKQLNQASMENDVNLQYGMQLIADSMVNQEQPEESPMRRVGAAAGNQESNNGESAVGHRSGKDQQQLEDEEQRDIENFQDSPRQNDRHENNDDTQRQFMNYNHQFGAKRASQASLGVSERSTPHVTVPDMDQDSLLSSNWPIHLGSYNRKKKLIRDVSTKSEQVRQHFLSTGQLQQIPAQNSGLRQSTANLGMGSTSGFPSAQNYIKGEQQKKNGNGNQMKRKGQFENRGHTTRVQSAMPKSAQALNQMHSHSLHQIQMGRTGSGHGLASMQQQFMPMQNSNSRQSPGAVANIQNTSGTSVSNDLIGNPPRGSYRVGVMTSTNQGAENRYISLLPSQDNGERLGQTLKLSHNSKNVKRIGASMGGTAQGKNMVGLSAYNRAGYQIRAQTGSSTPIQAHTQGRKVSYTSKTPADLHRERPESYEGAGDDQERSSQQAAGSINRTPKSTIAGQGGPGRIMNQPPAAQQPLRSGSQDPKYGLTSSASQGNLQKKQYGLTGPFARTFGAQGYGPGTVDGQNATDLDDRAGKSGQQGPKDLASARSLFGRGKRPLHSMRLDPAAMNSGANLQSINVGSKSTKVNSYNKGQGQQQMQQPQGNSQQSSQQSQKHQQRFDQFINLMGYQNNNRTNFYQPKSNRS